MKKLNWMGMSCKGLKDTNILNRNVFYPSTATWDVQSEQRSGVHCGSHAAFKVCFFRGLLTVSPVFSMLFLPPGGCCSAHKHQCLQGVLTVCQGRLWSTGSTLTAQPRQPIHPPAGKHSHPLSVSKMLLVAHQGQIGPQWCVGSNSYQLFEIQVFITQPLNIIYTFLMISVISL